MKMTVKRIERIASYTADKMGLVVNDWHSNVLALVDSYACAVVLIDVDGFYKPFNRNYDYTSDVCDMLDTLGLKEQD